FRGGQAPLNSNRIQKELNIRPSFVGDLHDVSYRRSGRRRDDADSPWKQRQRTFAGSIEDTFLGETLLQLFESQLKRSHSLRLGIFNDHLVIALELINGDASSTDQAHAVF